MTYLLPATTATSPSFIAVLSGKIRRVTATVSTFLSTMNQPAQYFSATQQAPSAQKRNFKKYLNNKRFLVLVAVLVIIILLSGFAIQRSTQGSSSVLPVSDSRIDIKEAKKTQTLNKSFSFPLKDEEGKEVSRLKYTIESVEIRDEIVVQGKKATSVKGRTFLVLNLKITNDFNQAVSVNTRDYVRLQIEGMPEKLAPDIHNDPVEIQAISTKLTRIAFPIDEQLKQMTLQVGEITGSKETIRLSLQ